jgi:hypothetical protein
MADDKLRQFEAILGAVSKVTSDEVGGELIDARCPQCKASDFAQVSDLYVDALNRIDEAPDQADAVREGGMTNAQMVAKFKPPTRKSPALRVIIVAILTGAPAFYINQRFGETPGQFAYIGAAVASVIALLTGLRKYSDQYYAARKRWRHLYMCRKCGQLVAP